MDQERKAYYFLTKLIQDPSLENYSGGIDIVKYNKAKKDSPYPIDLLNWIGNCMRQLDDIGYSYKFFVESFGHYPGEGNWEEFKEKI